MRRLHLIKSVFAAFLPFLYALYSYGQSTPVYGKRTDMVDSMTKLTDSLITANAFYSFTRTDSMPGDSSTRTRQYYFDTESRCMVKCIIDTCFEDFHQTKYRQVVIYFHRGSWYHVAWQNAQTLEFDFGFSHNDFLKSNSAFKKAGRFRKKAVQEIIDRNMRNLVSEEIANSKFMQSRNFGN